MLELDHVRIHFAQGLMDGVQPSDRVNFLLKRKAGHGGSSGGAVLARTAAVVLRRSLLERRYLPPSTRRIRAGE